MSDSKRILARCAIAVVGLAGCRAAPPDRSPASLADLVAGARERMHARYAASTGIQLAIGIGDLDRARADAQRIASLDEPDLLPAWRPYVDDIRAAAAQVVASPDTITASRAMARLGRSCGRCHEATEARLVFPPAPAPPEAGKLGTQMLGHEWAAQRMWEGLIGPNDERWLAGARTLAAAPLTITAESGELGIADDVARTRAFAERALGVANHTDRATLYGDLLANCAHCHATIRRP